MSDQPAEDPPKSNEEVAPPTEQQQEENNDAAPAEPAQPTPNAEEAKAPEGAATEPPKAEGESEAPKEGDKPEAPKDESEQPKTGDAAADTPKEEAKGETKAEDAAPTEAPTEAPKEEQKAEAKAPVEAPKAADAADDGEGEEGFEKEESVHSVQMGADEYYPEDHMEKEIEDSIIPSRVVTKFAQCQGIESMKRYNLHFLDEKNVIYVTGNTYQILNIDTKEKRVFFGHDTDGIGSIAVHPSQKYFAVAEKGENWPNIYIYEYPSLKLYRIMRKGTEKAYSHIEFDRKGDMLASVGSAPDFTLTVWNWLGQKVILKAKAFSQEVYKVCFSPYHDGILTSSGTGHIRFWKMASTFTGLKLQGEIGKFGQLELSDVTGFRELPDGKVVSGTEYGTLMLWEGNLIKAHLVLDVKEKTPLHNGHIEFVTIEGEHVITAGGDGYIKYWDLSIIDQAEADEIMEVAIVPLNEIQVKDQESGEPAYITHMIKGIGFWLVFDANGKIWKILLSEKEYREVTHFHSGGIADLVISDEANAAITLGSDGAVKLWDFIKGEEHFQKKYDGGGSCIDWMPRNELNLGRVVACGFKNGIVRVLAINEKGFDILQSFKAHDVAINRIKFSPDGNLLLSAAEDGTMFFFDTKSSDLQDFPPLCMVNLESKINDFIWDGDSKKILVGCANGYVYEIEKPEKSKIENRESYEVTLPRKEWKMKMMEFQMKKNQKKDEEELEKRKRMRLRGELPPEDEDEDEDWDPEEIMTVSYAHDTTTRFIVTSVGQYTGWYYICSFDSDRPLQAIDFPKKKICTLFDASPSNEFIVTGLEDGSVQIRHCEYQSNTLQLKMHDGHTGSIKAAKFSRNENYLVTVGGDGLIYVHAIAREAVKTAAQEIELSENILFDEESDGIERLQLTKELKTTRELNVDADAEAYSIQQSKLRTEEDHRLRLAEEKKEGVRDRIKNLRNEFASLVVKNKDQSDWIQMTEEEFNIDPIYFEMLEQRNNDHIDEAKKEVAWNVEWHTVALNKLKNKFFDVLEYEKFTVIGIKTTYYVTTFRVQKQSEFLSKNIEDFKAMLESEITGKGLDDEFQSIDSDQKGNEESRRDQSITKISIGAGQVHHATGGMGQQTQNNQNQGGKQKTEAEKKREDRKIARELKKKKLEKLEKKEAKYSAEDPEERKKIELAKQTYGDYKLKMSKDYVVPENQRVNASKKRQQMVLLEGSIHKLKVDFNKRVEDLKFRKKEIIETSSRINQRLGEINTELAIEEDLFLPSIVEEVEYPEKYFDVTDKEIKQFVKLKVKREKEKNVKKSMFTSKKEQAAEDDQEDLPDEEEIAAEKARKAVEDEEKRKKEMQVVERKGKKQQESDVENEVKKIREIQLLYEKDQLQGQINEEIKKFDEDVEELQKEKYRLESDLKQAEMKLITFYEELILLNSMESKDQELTKMLAECRQNKGNILKEINEISRKLKEKKKEIEEIKEREDELMRRFHDLCPEGSQFYDEILAFFKKIIKRRKRAEKVEKTNEDGDEDDEDMYDEDEEEDDDEDEDENDAAYKFNQEDHKIDDIEKLREDRMDLYDEKTKIEVFINDLENQRKKLEMNEKRIKNDLQNTEEEIQDFQKDKMAKLNQLMVSIVLRTKQIQNLSPDEDFLQRWAQVKREELEQAGINPDEMSPNNTLMNNSQLNHENLPPGFDEPDWRGYVLPADVLRTVLFTRQGLLGLIDRKRELDEEHRSNQRLYRECAEDTKRMRKDIKEGLKRREEADRHYKEKQMLRFGDLVDLDSLEVSGPSLAVTELQDKFRKKERQCILNISDAESELEKTQRDLTQSVKNNTNLLNLIIQLGKDQLDLNKTLDSTNKAIFVDEDDEQKNNLLQEKEKLREMLEIQAKEIQTLKTEINLYKKKGGHIYTKVTTNRRAGNLGQQQD